MFCGPAGGAIAAVAVAVAVAVAAAVEGSAVFDAPQHLQAILFRMMGNSRGSEEAANA